MNPEGRLIAALFCRLMVSSEQPLIWIIEGNYRERANLRAVLIGRGCEVEGFVSILHAVVMLYRKVSKSLSQSFSKLKTLHIKAGNWTNLPGSERRSSSLIEVLTWEQT